jgi:hypothetical protein
VISPELTNNLSSLDIFLPPVSGYLIIRNGQGIPKTGRKLGHDDGLLFKILGENEKAINNSDKNGHVCRFHRVSRLL